MTTLRFVPAALALTLSATAFAADAILLNPASLHRDLEVVVLAETATVDRYALAQVRATLIDPTFLVRDGSIGLIDPTFRPAEREVSADGMADDWLSTDDLDPTSLLGMEGIPVMRAGTGYLAMSGVLVCVPDDPIGANPTPYPHPLPTLEFPDIHGWYPDIDGWYPQVDGWLVGLEPLTFLVGDGRSWVPVTGVALLLDGDDVVGAIGTPTLALDGAKVRTKEPVLMLAWE